MSLIHTGRILATGAVLLALGGACGANSQAPLSVESIALPEVLPVETMQPSASLFIPGESMSFDISLRGVLGGTAVLGVGEPGVMDGRSVIIVQSLVRSAGVLVAIKQVRDQVFTWVDLDEGVVLKHEAQSKFGKKEASVDSDLGGGKTGPFAIDYKPKNGKVRHAKQKLPADAYAFDAHAILGRIRAWEPEDGDEKSFFLLSGRRLWRSSMRVGVHETITTTMGRRPAIRIDGVAQRVTRSLADLKSKKPRNYSIWISDDVSRLPLLVMAKTEYGDLRLELVEYRRPDRRVSTR
ncbi:MAG: DUF3108 domain-containing protein [Myxococcales bacterium]|nr:DUF3108 domain-containing protein [Myxococcales bacterium]